jgi:hypothetical protein
MAHHEESEMQPMSNVSKKFVSIVSGGAMMAGALNWEIACRPNSYCPSAALDPAHIHGDEAPPWNPVSVQPAGTARTLSWTVSGGGAFSMTDFSIGGT